LKEVDQKAFFDCKNPNTCKIKPEGPEIKKNLCEGAIVNSGLS